MLNEFDNENKDNPFKANDKKNCRKELKMNNIENKLNFSRIERKEFTKLKDKISDFVVNKIEKDLKDIQEK